MLAIPTIAFAALMQAQLPTVSRPIVTDSSRIVRLRDGTVVELLRGAKIDQPLGAPRTPIHVVDLEGQARFKVRSHLILAGGQIVATQLAIRTRGAMLLATNGDIDVHAHGDTTDVALLPRTESLRKKGVGAPLDFLVVSPSDTALMKKGLEQLREGERAQGIRGFMPRKLMAANGRE